MKSLEEPRGMGANPLAAHGLSVNPLGYPNLPPSPRMSPRMRRGRPSSLERQQRREVRRALGELQEVRRQPVDCQEIRRSPIDRQEMRHNSAERQYEARRSPIMHDREDNNNNIGIDRDIGRRVSGDSRQEVRRTSAERQEIKEYLDKLRHLVPACPKAGKLSRLTVIQHVIDYIVELQDTLVHHPVNAIDSLVQGATDPITAIMTHHLTGPAIAAAVGEAPDLPSPAVTSNTTVTPAEGAPHEVAPTRETSDDAVVPAHHNGIKDSTNTPSVRSKTSSTTNTSSTNISSKKSSCRRPLGVLSSLKNNRMH
ncbi:unnamed protein product [Meganyctiphanes norvegica]|uniref:BHLH domain-containing protein n=1 Tax=Meganyctiphanes norvegica TaxID=48144 RepID=A0AAV2RPJ7_MEGNR